MLQFGKESNFMASKLTKIHLEMLESISYPDSKKIWSQHKYGVKKFSLWAPLLQVGPLGYKLPEVSRHYNSELSPLAAIPLPAHIQCRSAYINMCASTESFVGKLGLCQVLNSAYLRHSLGPTVLRQIQIEYLRKYSMLLT